MYYRRGEGGGGAGFQSVIENFPTNLELDRKLWAIVHTGS